MPTFALQTDIKPPGPQEPWYKGRNETSWSTKQEILLFYFLRADAKYSLTHILKIKRVLMTKEKDFKSNTVTVSTGIAKGSFPVDITASELHKLSGFYIYKTGEWAWIH